MADWAFPVLTSLYTDVLNILKERDVDTASLFVGGTGFSTAPENAIHLRRSDNVFHEKIGGAWVIKAIGIAGGGTGGSNAADARTNLGIGTMGVQNANNVAITGGTITGIASFGVSGAITAGGNITSSGPAGFIGIGAYLTNLDAGQIDRGILPAARIPDPLPALNSFYLYNINGSNVTQGSIPSPQLGSGAANSAVFLRGDRVWTVPPSAGGLPAGAVIFFTTPCPPGFTHIAGWNGYYVRMGGSHVAGGANTHAHGGGSYAASAHTHGAGTLSTPSHNHGGATGSVSISISGTTGGGGSHWHGYSGTISGTTGGENNGSMNCDAGGSGTMARSGHGHSFAANYSDDTTTVGTHTHSFSGSGSGTGTISSQGGMGINGSTASAGGGGITGSSDAQNNMPLYIDFYACMKD